MLCLEMIVYFKYSTAKITVREDTIKELTAAEITKWVDSPMQASVKKTRKDLAKKGRRDQNKV